MRALDQPRSRSDFRSAGKMPALLENMPPKSLTRSAPAPPALPPLPRTSDQPRRCRLAMDFYIKLDAVQPGILDAATAAIAKSVESSKPLVLDTYREVLEAAGAAHPLSLRIANDIPSAKAVAPQRRPAGGIALAVYFGGLHWTDDRSSVKLPPRTPPTMPPPAGWAASPSHVCVGRPKPSGWHRPKGSGPAARVPSRACRPKKPAASPGQYSRADASRMCRIPAAARGLHQGRPTFFHSLEDRIHQPYRAASARCYPLCRN